MSSVGWIDFSSEHREKVRTVIDLLSAPGVVDELGIGVIRDSFADRMFPGLSTIQTRAKYFTLTALLLRKYQLEERPKRKPRKLERFLEEEEKACRIILAQRHGVGRQNLGIIGGSFGVRTDRDVVRRASSVYWNGLRQFQFVYPPGLSLSEFGRRFSDEKSQLRSLLEETKDDPGDDQDAEDASSLIRILTPEIPKDYWDELSIDLTREEACFLRDQIRLHQSNSVIGQIMRSDSVMDQVINMRDDADFSEFSELPFVAGLKNQELQSTVRLARDFWRIMYGAHIRYNCLLQAGFGTSDGQADAKNKWDGWREEIARFPVDWDSGFMWASVSKHGSQVKDSTRYFINGWIDQARQGAGDISRCNELVVHQEHLNKGKRARLRPGNQDAVNGWVGLERVEYRLPQVRQLVRDVRDGEQRKGGMNA